MDMGAVAVGALLSAGLLVILAAMLWQEVRRRSSADPVVYAIEDATAFVYGRLGDPAERLQPADVRRILEWGLYQHQVVRPRRGDPPPVFGSGDHIGAILDHAEAEGYDYDPVDVGAVLAAESEYLVEIGAVGERVEGEPK